MASPSNVTFPGRMLTDPKSRGNMAFLDMSLDEIIMLRKIGNTSTEEGGNETQNCGKMHSVSRGRSDAPGHHREKECSEFRNDIEERNHGKKPYQESSGFKSGQSPLNRQPLIKQEKCNDKSKTQAERNGGQSEEKRSQDQLEENRHHSERSQGHSERSHCQSKRSQGQLERSYGQSERFHGQSERSRGHTERSRGQSGRFHVRSERSHDQLERSCGHSERFHGHSGRSHDHSKRSHVLSERSYSQSGRSHGQSERSHGQSGRYRRYSPAGRFRASPQKESEFERSFIIKKKNEYYQKGICQRNYQMNVNRGISPANDHDSYENYRRSERFMRHGVRALHLTAKYATIKNSPSQPRGIYLKYNFQAMGNQTKLSLNERFSKLKVRKGPGSIYQL
ncbi:leucine zipper protein 4 isoform X1 [Equus przewalskii]|uniref:Leucine zipper protein 4 isoform X1 n=2 Tax=Equus przewalskii TaxID=9798 RepID=A0ABM4N5L8_EQUPR